MVFLGFAAGTWLGMLRGKKEGISPAQISDLALWILISSLAGARLAYVAAHLEEFKGRWLDIINPLQSDGTIGIAGLVILGGLLAAVPVGWWHIKRRGLSFPQIADIMAPSITLGIALGRIGCHLNGCCFGRPTHLPWGVTFPVDCYAGSVFPNTPIHPTQAYETLYCALITAALLWWTPRRHFRGELFAWFLVLYGLFRAVNEALRWYQDSLIPLHWGPLAVTGSMLISTIMVVIGALALINGYRSEKASL